MKPQKFAAGLFLATALTVTASQANAGSTIHEQDTAKEGALKLGLFYDGLSKATLDFTLEQPTLFGSDDNFTLNLSYSAYISALSVRSTDPDLFESPWSRTFSFATRQVSADRDMLRGYSFGTWDAEVSVARDLGARSGIELAAGYTLLDFKRSEDLPLAFSNSDVLKYDQVQSRYAALRYRFSTLAGGDAVATSGSTFGTSLELGNAGPTQYGIVRVAAQHVLPIGERAFARVRFGASAGFSGSQEFPFNKKTSVGGPGTVRGVKQNALGPVSPMEISGEDAVVGGQYALTSSLEVGAFVTPNRSLAVFAFTDAGNAADSTSSLRAADLVKTQGIGLRWQSPLGPLDVSYARPVHPIQSKLTQEFQFTLGWVF